MELKEFMKGISLMPEVVEQVICLSVTEEQYQFMKGIFVKDKEEFYKIILKQKNFRMIFLYYFCRMGCETYEKYVENGICDDIFWDTFRDITYWCQNCFDEYGEYGINEYTWFFRHIDLTIFRLGRLEFEKMSSIWNFTYREKQVREGDPIISIHIPQGEKLDIQASLDSIRYSFQFWGNEYLYICNSWLLYTGLREVLEPESNILKFQKLFKIVQEDHESREAEWRIFSKVRNDPREYSEETRLQRAAKQYLIEGGKLGSGLGILHMK